MPDCKKIIWLASYPKSGNTWFRAFLTALLDINHNGFNINQLCQTTIASNRQLFDEFSGVEASDLSFDEIDILRPEVYRLNALESKNLIYHKTHDAWRKLKDGTPIFQSEVTRAVIYIIRNPLDVVVSFAGHLSLDIDKTIGIINDPEFSFCSKPVKLHNQLRQKLLTWSGHVKSWVDDSSLPVHIMRYEDMLSRPVLTFTEAVRYIGLSAESNSIEHALEQCSFEKLQMQELERGFSEKSPRSPQFFRKGISGDWKNCLSEAQVKRIIESHRSTMERFGYL